MDGTIPQIMILIFNRLGTKDTTVSFLFPHRTTFCMKKACPMLKNRKEDRDQRRRNTQGQENCEVRYHRREHRRLPGANGQYRHGSLPCRGVPKIPILVPKNPLSTIIFAAARCRVVIIDIGDKYF